MEPVITRKIRNPSNKLVCSLWRKVEKVPKSTDVSLYMLPAIKQCILSIFKTQKTVLEATFKDREPLSTNEFYNQYYKEKEIPFHVVNGVKHILETELGADLSRLSNKDDFAQNLSFFWDFDSLADVSIVISLEKFFSIKIEDSEAESMHTIDDIVYFVTNKLNKA